VLSPRQINQIQTAIAATRYRKNKNSISAALSNQVLAKNAIEIRLYNLFYFFAAVKTARRNNAG